MKITELPKNIADIFRDNGFESLNPPQQAAVKAGLLEGKSLVVASPTASGKTLIAEMAFLKNFLERGKSLYIVPLKALASEKYYEFNERYKSTGMKIAVSVGDYDTASEWLGNYDLIIASNEKVDSLLRHNVSWISSINLIICDEIHLLNDASRGPTLEMVLTQLMAMTKSQIIALSATIKNSEEIAKWLHAELIESDYRPVKLYYGTFHPNTLDIEKKGKSELPGSGEPEILLASDTLKKGKQALVFVSTRRSAEASAERIGKKIVHLLTQDEKNKLKKISLQVLKSLSTPTKQCRRLADIVANGAAFHHAGLVAKQRALIEENFRSGFIKIICATPTLAFGMNLPAWRVVVRDVKRYGNYGIDYLPVLDVHQMAGRAGRPKYDKDGEAILIAKTQNEADELAERYISGKPEPIYSKLATEPMLRFYTLALIASGTERMSGLESVFSKTFFAHQYGDMKEVTDKLENILIELKSYGFIKIQESNFDSTAYGKEFVPAFDITADKKLKATDIGKRVSELYLDPLSAHKIINSIHEGKTDELKMFMSINSCAESMPLLRAKQKDDFLEEELMNSMIETPDPWNYDYEEFLDIFKTSLMFIDWANEITEDKLLEKYGIAPGELYAKTTNAEWLLYAASEMARLLEKKEAAGKFSKLRLRIKYGAKEELLRLVAMKGIGRVRARLLYKNSIRSLLDIKKSSIETLQKILGSKKLAEQLKSQTDTDFDANMKMIKRMGKRQYS
ncbi:MAG: DEAD/DEAH box helicase [Candidatus Aenigmatarchaeota archaeon]